MNFLGVEEVKALIGVKKSAAYKIIQRLNKELNEKGYLTLQGKVPERYLRERYYDTLAPVDEGVNHGQ